MSRGLYNFPHGCIKRPEKQFKEEGSSLEINSVMEGQHGHGGWSSLCGSRSCTYFVTSQRLEVERTWLASALTCKICRSEARPPGRPQLLKVPQFSKEYCQLGTKYSNIRRLEIFHIQTITDVEYHESMYFYSGSAHGQCYWLSEPVMEGVIPTSKDCCEH